MGKTFLPYNNFWEFAGDCLQPLWGVGNIILGATWIVVFAPLSPFFAEYNKPSDILGIPILYPLASIFAGIFNIIGGLTQIAVTPLTWLLKIPLRLTLSLHAKLNNVVSTQPITIEQQSLLVQPNEINPLIEPTSLDEALMFAAAKGDNKQVESLLKDGADPSYYQYNSYQIKVGTVTYHRQYSENAFCCALKNGHDATVALLFRYQDPIDDVTLGLAIKSGHKKNVKLLLDNGAASFMATNEMPLRIAATEGLTSIVKLLLKRGATSQGDALLFAVINRHTATVNVLLARLTFLPAILHHALKLAAINGDNATVNLLLNFTTDRSSALLAAADAGHASTLQLLLDNQLNNDSNILYTAAERGQVTCVEMLVNKVFYDSAELAQALKKAAYNGHTLTVKVLLEHGATLATTLFGLWSAANGHKQVYQYLKAFHMHHPITFPINKLSIHDTNNIILQRPAQHWHNSALNLIYHEDAFLSLVTHQAIAQIGHAKGTSLPLDMLIYISNFLSFEDKHALGSITLAKVGRINQYLIEQKNPQQQYGFTALSHYLFNYPLKPSASAVKFIKEKHATMRSGLFSTFTSKARLLADIVESDDELISAPPVMQSYSLTL